MLADKYENKSLCSDGGAILGDMPEEKEPVDPNPGGGGTTPSSSDIKLEVLSKEQRHGLISLAVQEKQTEELFDIPVTDSDDSSMTFKILLLIVGVLLIIVAGLLIANTWVTRKHLRANLYDRDQLRMIRI